MKTILIPVDAANPERTRSAVTQAIRIHAQEPVKVHLLSVQPLVSGHVSMFFAANELEALRQSAGAEALEPAQQLLDASQVPYTSEVRVGRSAETIARTAGDVGCDRILLGPERAGTLAGKVFGSLSGQVRHLLAGSSDCQVIGA